MARVSVDDLLLAAEWCESYEAAPEVVIVMDYSHGGMSPRPLYVVAPL